MAILFFFFVFCQQLLTTAAAVQQDLPLKIKTLFWPQDQILIAEDGVDDGLKIVLWLCLHAVCFVVNHYKTYCMRKDWEYKWWQAVEQKKKLKEKRKRPIVGIIAPHFLFDKGKTIWL